MSLPVVSLDRGRLAAVARPGRRLAIASLLMVPALLAFDLAAHFTRSALLSVLGLAEGDTLTEAGAWGVLAAVWRRAEGSCEGCGQPAPFVTARGHPYLEPHHTRRLSDGGPDDFHHVIALCPTCHRRVHHAADGDTYNQELRDKLKTLET